MTPPPTALDAYIRITAHEEVCAERYKTINDKLETVNKQLSFAGKTLVAVVLALVGWLAVEVYNLTAPDPAPAAPHAIASRK